MNNQLSSLPGYRQCDYMLTIHPHEDLADRIATVKKTFAEKNQMPSAEWGRPQILLARFTQLQFMEERLTNRLHHIAMAMPAFKVNLKDYGSFPSHTIFIDVESTAALQMVVKALRPAQRLMQVPGIKPYFLQEFYIPIVRKLEGKQFDEAWKEYSHRHFTGSFIAKSMVLLRRLPDARNFQPVRQFMFENMPVLTTQGALF